MNRPLRGEFCVCVCCLNLVGQVFYNMPIKYHGTLAHWTRLGRFHRNVPGMFPKGSALTLAALDEVAIPSLAGLCYDTAFPCYDTAFLIWQSHPRQAAHGVSDLAGRTVGGWRRQRRRRRRRRRRGRWQRLDVAPGTPPPPPRVCAAPRRCFRAFNTCIH